MQEVPGSEFEMQADLVLLAMGFVSPVQKVLDAFGVEKDARGNAKARPKAGLLSDQHGQGIRRGRHAPRPIAGGVGDPRRPPVRACGRRVPDGIVAASPLDPNPLPASPGKEGQAGFRVTNRLRI